MSEIEALKNKNKALQKKLTNAYSFIRSLKSLYKKGEDLGIFLEEHSSKDLEFRYNKYDLIVQALQYYYMSLEHDEACVNKSQSHFVTSIEEIINSNNQ